MFKKMFVLCLMLVMLCTSASAGGVTVGQWMNETDVTTKRFYAQGLEEGMISGYLFVANNTGVSDERVDRCMSSIDSLNSNFNNYLEAVNNVVIYHVNNGGKTDALLTLVVANAYLNTDSCRIKAKGTDL